MSISALAIYSHFKVGKANRVQSVHSSNRYSFDVRRQVSVNSGMMVCTGFEIYSREILLLQCLSGREQFEGQATYISAISLCRARLFCTGILFDTWYLLSVWASVHLNESQI